MHLETKIKKYMKNYLMTLYEKILLKKRSVIETMNMDSRMYVEYNTPDTAFG